MPPITLAGTSWCGFTTAMKNAIEESGHADRFRYVDCGTDAQECSDVTGFPTFKLADGTVCHTGYTPDVEAVLEACSSGADPASDSTSNPFWESFASASV